ncbi:GNAT family N-acetyltransferase [Phaeovulum vinaykumarii]|uniref:Protein N-acetyltransferase, RimJ/RimL family n=1 Tax=Phaeovulum vinaykumarii TaxID=407234 RepID=A0A1N7MK30_9RHOB|nr:GNAT family N-acetyltransferase [Phaeovulum vinaykumarii]SIS86524.1 Protein N-acetyltransferase, RimJ/RimL family [Phaeovulum vinaykumarii]SOC13533.1 RimJ/RimL family protein N-acetyltransferase [Phaeovulum vinaykumarii]
MITLSPTPELRTERLVLRAPAASDWPIWRDFILSDRGRFMRPADMDEALAWRAFGHVIGHWVMRGFGAFVFTRAGDDRALGMAGPWHPAGWPEPEILWSVWDAAAQGQGLAREAARATLDHAFRDLGWTTAVSYIAPDNTRSIALARGLGAVADTGAAVPDGRPAVAWRHKAPSAPEAA